MIRVDEVHAIRHIARACQLQFVPGLNHCIAYYDRNDRLMGGVLFTDFMGGSIQLHVAGFQPNWVNRELLYLTFDYPFVQLKVKKLLALIPEWNYKSRNNALKMGFKIEYKADDIFNHRELPNGMYFMSMRKDECKYLQMPQPLITYAPQDRTSRIDPFVDMPAVGMLQ